MSTSIQPLVIARIIEDVVDFFSPSITMAVHYGPQRLMNACRVKPSMVQHSPVVRISGKPGDLYTLLLIDPDVPSPANPTEREMIHWMVVNIPGGTDSTRGDEALDYVPPNPQVGIHRFAFVLFRQTIELPPDGEPESRADFNTRLFAAMQGLGLPVNALFFTSRWEPMG